MKAQNTWKTVWMFPIPMRGNERITLDCDHTYRAVSNPHEG